MNDVRDPFDGLRPTPVPPALRERVLGAAREALLAAPKPTAWDWLFESRGLRVAWAAACLALVIAHLTLGPTPRAAVVAARTLDQTLDAAPELRAAVELPAVAADVQLGLGMTLVTPSAARPHPGDGKRPDLGDSKKGVPS